MFLLRLNRISIYYRNRPPIVLCLSDNNNKSNTNSSRKTRIVGNSVQPQSVKQLKQKTPSVAEIERAIGAGIFKDRDINRESEPEKTLFDSILSNSIGRTEGDVEKKLRETGEWILDQTEGSSRSPGKNILKVVFLWILPVWIVSFLVASGVVKLPFVSPYLDDLIM
ncbi:probable NAD(P)H dehydrogenase subunit CRR3, chloroplastic [Rutidosis leptorrhynchoides]|uniref:probable NAD(P)H dehydrogenase subunit CRR3, chloroplastic n=1 Tax=Rutidosis leptorrhynchoides TaxID=125765 RepID=UPI003A99374D